MVLKYLLVSLFVVCLIGYATAYQVVIPVVANTSAYNTNDSYYWQGQTPDVFGMSLIPDADNTRYLGTDGVLNWAGVYTYLVGLPTTSGSFFDFSSNYGVIGQIYDRTYTNILDLDANTFTGDCNTLDTYHASSFLQNPFTTNINANGYNILSGNIYSSNRYKVGLFSDNYAINLNYGPYITITNQTDIPSLAFTESMWVNLSGTLAEDYHILISTTNINDHQWIIQPDGEIQYYAACGTATTSDAGLVVGNWYHLALRRNSTGDIKMWKNGVELTMDTYSLNCALTTGDVQIGKRNDGSHPLRGSVDEVTIWNMSISDAQVVALYNSGTGVYGNSTSLPSYSNVWAGYHMDEGSGATSVTDFSGGQDGTIVGSPTWVTGKITGAIVQPDTGEQVLVIGNITSTQTIKANTLLGTILTITGLSNLWNTNINGDLNVTGNVHINGNVSFKRPYGMWSSTETQTATLANTAYVVTFNWTADDYLMTKQNNENFSVAQSGDYLIELSAIGVTDLNNKHVEVWVQKTNSTGQFVNIPRSNTKIEIENAGTEAPIVVPFIIDLMPTDKFRVMWASDDAGTQLVYTTNTSYSPETPSIIMTFSKISEITP